MSKRTVHQEFEEIVRGGSFPSEPNTGRYIKCLSGTNIAFDRSSNVVVCTLTNLYAWIIVDVAEFGKYPINNFILTIITVYL